MMIRTRLDCEERREAKRRLRLLECVGDGVRKESRPVAEKCRVAKAQAADLPYRRQILPLVSAFTGCSNWVRSATRARGEIINSGVVSGQLRRKLIRLPTWARCSGGAGRELHSHAMSGMRDPHHAFGMNFEFSRFQAKINQGTLRKWRVGFHVAAAQTQVSELAVRDGFVASLRPFAAAAFSQSSVPRDARTRSRKCTPVCPLGLAHATCP